MRGLSLKCISAVAVYFCLINPVLSQYPAGSPVAINGKLKVSGTHLVNACGNIVQLRGMSSAGLQYFPQCYNHASLSTLTSDWGIDVFRLAMYVDEGGYLTNPSYWKTYIDSMVTECGKLGIYCVIDWHILNPGDPNAHLSDAENFWSYMSARHVNDKQVLYEICNEPNGVSWSTIKSYANDIIPKIRANDPSIIIIVGTPTYSQDVDVASMDKLSYSNIMYTLHFYSGTHGQSLRDKGNVAIANGAALFVTECGTSTASGDGGPYLDSMQTWLNWMSANKISWINWNFSDKSETSAALIANACSTSSWNSTSTSGTFMKQKILSPADNFICGSGTNKPPVISLTSPANGAVFTAPATISIKANASDADGTVESVTFYNGSTALRKDTTYPYSYTWSNVGAGTYSIKAQATDDGGAYTTSSAITVTVTSSSTQANLKVQYKTADANATTNTLRPWMQIVNSGTTAVNLSDLKLRYWYTNDGATSQNYYCDYAGVGCGNITSRFVNLSGTVTGANNYVELGFTSGTLAANSSLGEIQDRIAKSDWSNYTQTGDYSFDASKTNYADWNKITLYKNGVLVWGTEPTGYSSSAVAASMLTDDNTLALDPNPCSNYTDLYYSSAVKQQAAIFVRSITAVNQLKINHAMNEGLNKVRLDVSSLASGTYYVSVVPVNGKSVVKKMVIIK